MITHIFPSGNIRFAAPLIAAIVLCPVAAWANNPPDPITYASVAFILPVLAICMALGGAFAVLAAQKRVRWYLRTLKVGILATIIASGFLAETFSYMVWLISIAIVIRYSAAMIAWGIEARRAPEKRRPFLRDVNPTQLRIAGLSALLLIFLFTHMFGSFGGRYPIYSRLYNLLDLRTLVDYQFRFAKASELETDIARYTIGPDNKGIWSTTFNDQGFPMRIVFWGSNFDIQLLKDNTAFKIWVWPRALPGWPYNYIFPMPSFFADQTGQIRRVYVHSPEKCPEDAPVVDIVKNGFAVQDHQQ